MSSKVERTCPICGTMYMVNPARLAKFGHGKTCSKACGYALISQRAADRTLAECAVCGTITRKTPSQRAKAKYGVVFCSRACHYKGRSLGLSKRTVTKPYASKGRTRTPPTEKPVRVRPPRPLYRSTIDEAAAPPAAPVPSPYRHARPQRRVYHWSLCTHCGREFDDPSDGRARKSGKVFCSLACCNAYRKGADNPAWRGGYDGYYGPNWRALRRAAWQRDGYACRRCGKTRAQIGRRPDVHHIKPVGTFPDPDDANTLDNLICTCHSCHMFLEWHGFDFEVNQPCVLVDVPRLRRARLQRRNHDPIACACGCGEMMDPYGPGGHRRSYLRNHQNRGRKR